MKGRRIGIIGGGLAGLAAAAILARRGHAVHLFERTERVGGKANTVVVDGIVLDTGPTLLTLPVTITSVLEDAGAAVPKWLPLETQCSYRFADGRGFEAYADVDRTAASVAAFASEDEAGLRSFYAAAATLYDAAGKPYLDAPFEGYVAYARRSLGTIRPKLALQLLTQTLADLASQHFRTAAMQSFAGRFATYVGTSPFLASPALAMIAHVERAFGVHHVVGGMRTIAESLAAAALANGAKLSTNADVVHRGGLVIGPRGTVDGERFDAVIVNEDPRARDGVERELALSGYVLLLASDVRLTLPHHRVIFARDYRAEFDEIMNGEPPTDPTIYLCHPVATDPSAAPVGASGLYAMINMPPRAPYTPEELAVVKERVLARIYAAEPALKGHLRIIGERTPNDFLALGAPGGSIYGHLEKGAFGPFRRPRMRGRPEGLFYAGGGTHPGGGVPMVLSSGRFAANMVSEHLTLA